MHLCLAATCTARYCAADQAQEASWPSDAEAGQFDCQYCRPAGGWSPSHLLNGSADGSISVWQVSSATATLLKLQHCNPMWLMQNTARASCTMHHTGWVVGLPQNDGGAQRRGQQHLSAPIWQRRPECGQARQLSVRVFGCDLDIYRLLTLRPLPCPCSKKATAATASRDEG